jgi:hypothetical protein
VASFNGGSHILNDRPRFARRKVLGPVTWSLDVPQTISCPSHIEQKTGKGLAFLKRISPLFDLFDEFFLMHADASRLRS